ncbi:hypothetical protein PGUG_01178 [Meyerozyma guilliermondii ATCC 6260]|uniref:NAD-dependent protein deacylase n=1 Tax=Meyerozyma guilliermondii (strain ATCC 6260 / CBS 566 / DSM 6381 / JCM 1539 / NBRC 10279 / NRRL Y-324) TaxID=294746 RepID=A5DD23_PICGU|nr:uncharacterized protein PGUG_01178 [Meyerozyma guilliermondii ATCC 6260]EDK37080.2 hypothetical protein PGUG_01178 [Meyerozyma guilliermondii ATCC 6260]
MEGTEDERRNQNIDEIINNECNIAISQSNQIMLALQLHATLTGANLIAFTPPMSNMFAEFHDHLRASKRIIALVGAGLSASSGLPTFRGTQGLWKNFNMIDLATPDSFYIDPGLVWQFYSWRRQLALEAQPNNGHRALAKLSHVHKDFITITQNVDGLSARANHNPERLLELHGSLFELKCTGFTCNYIDHENFNHPLTPQLAGTEQEKESSDGSPEFTPVKQLSEKDLPCCPVCGELLRPGVVWFGESLPLITIDTIDNFLQQGKVDLILVIGTSGTVYPANSYVERVRLQGGKVAIFNTDIEEDILQGKQKDTWGFHGDAAELLPLALEPLIGQLSER